MLSVRSAPTSAICSVSDFVDRVRIGRVPVALNRRVERKRNLTAHTSFRWAGAITRVAEDQYQLGMRALADEVSMLESATRGIWSKLAAPLRDAPLRDAPLRDAPVAAGTPVVKPGRKTVVGYRNAGEHAAKTVRLHMLETRLAAATARRDAGHPCVVLGGGRLWRNRQNLSAAGLSESQWRARWDAAWMFLTAEPVPRSGTRPCGSRPMASSL